MMVGRSNTGHFIGFNGALAKAELKCTKVLGIRETLEDGVFIDADQDGRYTPGTDAKLLVPSSHELARCASNHRTYYLTEETGTSPLNVSVGTEEISLSEYVQRLEPLERAPHYVVCVETPMPLLGIYCGKVSE